jgi:hypothetical protein
MTSIKKNYDISSDWKGNAYCGLKIDWDYTSMHGYIKSALHKYQYPATDRAEHAPHKWNLPVYGANTKYIEDGEEILDLSPKDANRLQQRGCTLLYYDRAVDPTLIMPVNVLASEQTRATADTAVKIIKLLNYCTTHPEATLQYHASDMILNIHTNSSYLSERETKSRAGAASKNIKQLNKCSQHGQLKSDVSTCSNSTVKANSRTIH